MDEKPNIELAKKNDELLRLRTENQRLRATVDRVERQRDQAERQRDDAESRFANSQIKIIQLEQQVRKHMWKIEGLEAERTLPEARSSIPPPPAAPCLPSEVIEISDHDDDQPSSHAPKRSSAASKPEQPIKPRLTPSNTPKQERLVLDYVSMPPSPFSSPVPSPRRSPPSESPSSGRFKRARSESPAVLVERSASSTLVDDNSAHLISQGSGSSAVSLPRRSVSPVAAPSVKRQKTSKVKVKEIKKEIKKEAFALPQDVVDQYLHGFQDLDIDPAPRDTFYVSRKFLRLEFGGSDQHFIAHFTPTDGSDKGRAVVFPQPDLNPFLPPRPGATGLIFASRLEITQSSPWALFCKDKPSGEAVWRYMGDYENTECGVTTAEQFQRQTQEVKQSWGKRILVSKKWEVYVRMRARIALRKTGRLVADDDEAVAREMQRIKAKRGIPLTVDDVIEALSRGEEEIKIIRMQCVSYDQELVADMERKHDAWIAPAAGAAHARTTANKRPKRTTMVKDGAKGKGKGKQPPARGRNPALESDSASSFSVESEEPASELDSAAIRPRRRRAAPRPRAPASSAMGLESDAENLSDLTEYEY
ncbi:hypothetical protein B0H11DRAFT_2282735 [Mycena galericulata]|nr:hypothetical protein B0H11DRAFT_2282735 [Mycena galericulata]